MTAADKCAIHRYTVEPRADFDEFVQQIDKSDWRNGDIVFVARTGAMGPFFLTATVDLRNVDKIASAFFEGLFVHEKLTCLRRNAFAYYADATKMAVDATLYVELRVLPSDEGLLALCPSIDQRADFVEVRWSRHGGGLVRFFVAYFDEMRNITSVMLHAQPQHQLELNKQLDVETRHVLAVSACIMVNCKPSVFVSDITFRVRPLICAFAQIDGVYADDWTYTPNRIPFSSRESLYAKQGETLMFDVPVQNVNEVMKQLSVMRRYFFSPPRVHPLLDHVPDYPHDPYHMTMTRRARLHPPYVYRFVINAALCLWRLPKYDLLEVLTRVPCVRFIERVELDDLLTGCYASIRRVAKFHTGPCRSTRYRVAANKI